MTSDTVISVIGAGVVSFIVALLTTEYRMRRQQTVETKDEINTWYAETAQLAKDVNLLWQNEYKNKLKDGNPDRDAIKRQMSMRSRQINTHVGQSSSLDVDQNIVDELEELSQLCASMSDIVTGMGASKEFEKSGEEVAEKAESIRESSLNSIQN